MKGIDLDMVRTIVNRQSSINEKNTTPIRVHDDTVKILKKLKKANGLKSYRAVIELLVATVALTRVE